MSIKTILKWYLLIGSLYLIGDGLWHLFDLKFLGVTLWPEAPLVYSKFISHLYGGSAILIGLFGVEIQKDLDKYKNFLWITAWWTLAYGAYLLYSSFSTNFVEIFSQTPSIYAWMPFYNSYLLFEGGSSIILSLLIFKWHMRKN